jgi:glycosyltransferase involved in cell wall biosynthesis
MAKQRICFFNSNLAWGGGEKWHYTHALAFREMGYDVIGITNLDSPLARKWTAKNLPTHQLKLSNLSFLNLPKLLRVKNILKHNHIETVILNLSADLKIGGLAAWAGKIQQIVYRRGQALPVRNTFLNRFLFRKILTHIVANSEEIKQQILSNNPCLVPEKDIHVLYNAIELDNYPISPKTPIFQRAPGELILGNAGRLVEQKGQRYLIRLAQHLKQAGLRFKLLIAGEGPLLSNLKEHADQMGVQDHIIFLGFVDNIKSFMDSIDIFVLSSLHEGSANIVLEAMAFKKPVVAFDISSNRELVRDNQTGYLVDFADIRQMTARIMSLHRHRDLRNQMGKNARKRIVQQHTRQDSVEGLIRIMDGSAR